MFTDLKYALRMLAKAPGFTAIAILTLALGIGANSAIFSVIDAVLLHPLPFPRPNQLVAVWSRVAHDKLEKETESVPDYVDLRDQSQTLSALAAFTRAGAVLNGTEEARQLYGVAITSDIFSVLGVPPARGRVYTREDDNVDARVVVLTDYAWKTYFNSDPEIVGKQVSLSWRLYTVLGVMPPGFQFPVEGERAEYLQPLHPLVPEAVNNRDSHFVRMVGRMKPGVTIQHCDAEMKTIAARLEKQYPKSNTDRSDNVSSLHDDIVGDVRPALITILAAVAFVLLIACANVANLLLARATARQREIAIRTALGASRTRIVWQLLGEGFLLSIFGAAGGLLIASWGIDFLRVFGPQDVPRLGEVAINPPVFFFTFAVAIFSTLLFGLVPALQMTRPNVNESLQEGSRGAVGPESHQLRRLLVIAQVALSLLLLAGAGLLIKSFVNLRATKPGFDPQHAMVAELILPKAKYPQPEKHRQFFERTLPKLAGLPGVETAGAAFPMPFSNNDWGSTFSIVGQPPRPPGQELEASHLTVTPDYFRAMGIRLIRGRVFTLQDDAKAPRVAVINETMARQYFPNEDPIGKRLYVDAGNDDIALFEQAHVYLPTGEHLPEERSRAGGIAQGGFAFAKGTAEGLYAALGVEPSFRPADDLPAAGRGARTDEGWVASVRDPDLPGEWGAFELDVDALVDRVPDLIVYEDVITYPPVRQDLAFVVSEEVTAGELVAAAREAAGPELREMSAFDVYRGGQVEPGKKSIAFSVTFQSSDRTLTDEDAAELRNRIVSALERAFGAQLRA